MTHYALDKCALRGVRILLAACLMAVGQPAMGQADAAAAKDGGGKALAYDIVSIRANNPASNGMNGTQWRMSQYGFTATNIPMSSLVHMAYGVLMESQIVGLPRWAVSEMYDVEAKADEDTATALKNLSPEERQKAQREMLQRLLAERCLLKAHSETRPQPVYDLVIAKSGLKMKESALGENTRASYPRGKIEAYATTIGSLTTYLPGTVGRLIVDKTGLGEKKYTFTLEWTPDEQRGTAEAGPSIFTALEEQLGLKLVPSKAPVETVVIDRMERPSAN